MRGEPLLRKANGLGTLKIGADIEERKITLQVNNTPHEALRKLERVVEISRQKIETIFEGKTR